MPHLPLTPTKRSQLAALVLILIFFTIMGVPRPQPIFAAPTRPPKACHICETILPDATTTATPDGCAADCLTPQPTSSQPIDSNTLAAPDPSPANLRIVFYWMDGCPHCEEVMETTLPALEQHYGSLLEIEKIELISVEDVDQLYQLGATFGLEREKIEVPFVVFDEMALSGQDAINQTLPGLIQSAFEEDSSIPTSTASPSPTPSSSFSANGWNFILPLLLIGGAILGGVIHMLRKKGAR